MVFTLIDIAFDALLMGYSQIVAAVIRNMRSREMLQHPEFGLVDVFNITIDKNRCYLSKRVADRAAYTRYGKLKLVLLHINYIFLLKAVTDRQMICKTS